MNNVNRPDIQPLRIQQLNTLPVRKGDYILYWMQQSQRVEYNHALEYAIREGNRLGVPIVVAFGITDQYPEANLRHYSFMLEGLRETQAALEKRAVKMVLRLDSPEKVAITLGKKAAMIVCDCGYLRHQKAWRQKVADAAGCLVCQVETDVIVPVPFVSKKAEYAARTIRPKLHRHLPDYLVPLHPTRSQHSSLSLDIEGVNIVEEDFINRLVFDRSIGSASNFFKGGTAQAKKRFSRFLQNRLARYDQNSNQPQADDISHMSMYLHFGQISPLYLALKVQKQSDCPGAAKAAFLEELIVRRELACNFVHYTPDYDRYTCIPQWACLTLDEHCNDRRDDVYSIGALEKADTHDSYWNAAMREMIHTGFMHNYMRMYWGKKIIEWSLTPEIAYQTTLALNNKYFIDGRDPNSFAGVAWLYGVHDRAWAERSIFGKVRYMAASGLERKCDIQGYIEKVNTLVRASSNKKRNGKIDQQTF